MPRRKGFILLCLVLIIRHVAELQEYFHFKTSIENSLSWFWAILRRTNRLISFIFHSGFHLPSAKIVRENLISPKKIEGMIKLKGEYYYSIQLFSPSFILHISFQWIWREQSFWEKRLLVTRVSEIASVCEGLGGPVGPSIQRMVLLSPRDRYGDEKQTWK